MDFDDLDDVQDAEVEKNRCGAAALSKSTEVQEKLCAGADSWQRWPHKKWGETAPEAPLMKPLVAVSEEEYKALPRPTYEQFGITKKYLSEVWDTQEPGDHYGLKFPHNIPLLESMGPEWMTKAFHAAGTLPKDNSVTAIKEIIGLSMNPSAGEALGGAGIKVLVTIDYAKPHPDLHTELFLKMPDPYDPKSERFTNVAKNNNDEPEILFYRLLQPALPVGAPKCYFGDISRKNGNAILILEKFNFAPEWKPLSEYKPFEIHPMMDKNKDYQCTESARHHYVALGRAIGALTAASQTLKLGTLEQLPPFFMGLSEQVARDMDVGWPPPGMKNKDPQVLDMLAAASERTATQTRSMCILGCDFVLHTCPQLFPDEVKSKQFLRRFVWEATHVAQYETEINQYCNSDWDFFSLSHGNCQLDNAFYYNNEQGQVEAGLWDFGGFSFGNPVNSLARNWIAAEPEVMIEGSAEILDAFIDGMAKNGSKQIDRAKVFHTARLTQALFPVSTASMLTWAFRLKAKNSDFWKKIEDRWDPEILNNFSFRFQTSNWRNQLVLWASEELGLYKNFLKWLEENPWLPKKKTIPPIPYDAF